MPGKKAVKTSRTLVAAIGKQVEKVLLSETDTLIAEVVDYLKEHPDVAKPCLMALKGGWFDQSSKSADQDCLVIPPTNTK
eukprot:320573-Lingulodinium_polyedra.AAC.1